MKFHSGGDASGNRVLLRREPRTFHSGDGYSQDILLDTNLAKFFPEPGRYTITFTLPGPNEKTIRSNDIQIEIKAPEGLDKEAYDFLQRKAQFSRSSQLFAWDPQPDNVFLQDQLLEEFVNRFASSAYGDLATLRLAGAYAARGNLDKAKAQYQRLVKSSNNKIQQDAAAALHDVERRIAQRQQTKP